MRPVLDLRGLIKHLRIIQVQCADVRRPAAYSAQGRLFASIDIKDALASVWRYSPAGGATHQASVRPPGRIGVHCQRRRSVLSAVWRAAGLSHSDCPSVYGPSDRLPVSPLTVLGGQHSDRPTVHGADWDDVFLHLTHSPGQFPHEAIPEVDALITDSSHAGQETSARLGRRSLRPAPLAVDTVPDPRGPLGLVSSRLLITTDASLQGWGANFQRRSASSLWEGDLLRAHINFLELMAVQLALSHFLPLLRRQHVLRTDNLTTMFYVNKQGGMRSDRLDGLARSLTLWCVDNLASLRAEYVPGLLNLGANLLSRGQARYDDWSLHPEVVELVWCRFGSPVADPRRRTTQSVLSSSH